jgi:nicotinate-nucleotide pyrophosphorylase (carboxylating)
MTPGWLHPEPEGWPDILDDAIIEDVGPGDLAAHLLSPDADSDWYIEAQGEGVVCGLGIAAELFDLEDVPFRDGDRVSPGSIVLRGELESHLLLTYERTALNFIMHLSGVATLTRRFVDAVEGLPVMIVDTRKTIPGLRALQKYAVRCGGGRSHRMGLYDALMIKDNHIKACGSITEAVAKARASLGHMVKIEVECEEFDQVREAVGCGSDVVLLDNMTLEEMRRCVGEFKNLTVFEASGGVNLETVRGIAETGVDVISVGALTHSAPALSFHLEVE